jgi:hypothetical protein
MIVLVFINNESDFGCATGTFLLKRRGTNRGIVPHNASNHLRAGLWSVALKSHKTGHETGLVKRKVAVL